MSIKVHDQVQTSSGVKGEVVRLERRPWGLVAVLFTGGRYTREIPVDYLTPVPDNSAR